MKKRLRKIVIIFLSISLYMCFGCSKEPSHRDGSFEYSQHMFWLRNKKNNFQLRTLVIAKLEMTLKTTLLNKELTQHFYTILSVGNVCKQ